MSHMQCIACVQRFDQWGEFSEGYEDFLVTVAHGSLKMTPPRAFPCSRELPVLFNQLRANAPTSSCLHMCLPVQ